MAMKTTAGHAASMGIRLESEGDAMAWEHEESIEILPEPIVFKVCNQRKQEDAGRRSHSLHRPRWSYASATSERPQPFERCTDQKTDGQFRKPACGKEDPQGSSVAIVLQAQLCQKRLNGTEDALKGRRASSNTCHHQLGRLGRSIPGDCSEPRILCSSRTAQSRSQ